MSLKLFYYRIVLSLSLSLIFSVGHAYEEINLISAYPAYQLDGIRDTAKILALKAKELNLQPRSPMTFTNLGYGNTYYALYSDMQIRAFDLSSKKYLGGWPLGAASPCRSDDIECIAPWWAGRWGENEVAEDGARFFLQPWEIISSSPMKASGCLSARPLRYGDLDADGKKELILIPLMENYQKSVDFIVFSTALRKVIFATLLNGHDVIDDQAYVTKQCPGQDKPTDPQFWQQSDQFGRCMSAAVNAFAKLYFDDLDADGNFDIIVWRKLYESRLNSDPVKGFIKKGDLLVHYKLVNGEYKKQSTDQAVIKSWLTAKQLTWSKGYPNKSECAGQEGQLILEMHDPLLNDPDVLQ